LECLHGSGESLATHNARLLADLHRIREQRTAAIKRAEKAEMVEAALRQDGAGKAKSLEEFRNLAILRLAEIERLKQLNERLGAEGEDLRTRLGHAAACVAKQQKDLTTAWTARDDQESTADTLRLEASKAAESGTRLAQTLTRALDAARLEIENCKAQIRDRDTHMAALQDELKNYPW
jgi:exonuclease SbcC